MGPTESGLLSILDLMHEGDYDPSHGKPVPIERIYAANSIDNDAYLRILAEMRDERRAYARGAQASAEGAESDELAERMRRAKVPTAFVSCAIDRTHGERLHGGSWIYVNGANVETVTRRACSCMKGWLAYDRFGAALFERSTTMTAALRASGSEMEAMSRFSSVGLLLISGMGSEVPTDLSLANLHAILDTRMGYRRPTIVTSRLSPADLAAHFGSRGNANMAMELVEMIQSSALMLSA